MQFWKPLSLSGKGLLLDGIWVFTETEMAEWIKKSLRKIIVREMFWRPAYIKYGLLVQRTKPEVCILLPCCCCSLMGTMEFPTQLIRLASRLIEGGLQIINVREREWITNGQNTWNLINSRMVTMPVCEALGHWDWGLSYCVCLGSWHSQKWWLLCSGTGCFPSQK